MQILSINTGQPRQIDPDDPSRLSGIYKTPIDGPVAITQTGVAGDVIVNTRNHGGIDQAVYVYGRPDYDAFECELGYPLPNGIFGENLTITGQVSAAFTIGDRLSIGDVMLEVTAPRTPCESLNARMGDTQFVKRFFAADRPGFYCHVLAEGTIRSGDMVAYHQYSRIGISIIDAHRIMRPGATHDTQTIRRFLNEPIHVRLRTTSKQSSHVVLHNGRAYQMRNQHTRVEQEGFGNICAS
jgi:MOSC domain-containing protein YiiM